MLIEASVKTYENELFGKDGNKLKQKINVLNQNKLYLTCIPVCIVKHRNPLSFLETATKYTITFVDSVGNRFTFRHKTLSEIVAALKDDGYAQSDEFITKPIGIETIVYKMTMLLTTKYSKADR